MNHDFESRLRRDARALEREAPPPMLARLREKLTHEPAFEPAVPTSITPRFLVAAALVLVAGSAGWFLHQARVATPASPRVVETPARPEEPQRASRDGLATSWSLIGWVAASPGSDPLSREWMHLKRDSRALLRGVERQLPFFAGGG